MRGHYFNDSQTAWCTDQTLASTAGVAWLCVAVARDDIDGRGVDIPVSHGLRA